MNNLQPFLFWLIASATALCAITVVVTQNIVRAATWLLFTLAGTSAIFFLLGADLVGVTQLLVYVGGTLVLLVFGVMLTAQGPFITMKTGAAEWAISAVVGFLFLGVLAVSAFSVRDSKLGPPEGSTARKFAPKERLSTDPANAQYSAVIGMGFLGVGVGPAHLEGNKVVRTNYLLPFEIVSVHLLVVLIGAAYLARAKRRRRVAS
ncbi:MAG TPA: NADH-quinone oxidoreductase subunit J [Gemmataceae bacterium]|nr:NADH-quinone oxidoreductase subunit J [Gemmataceae bacterium]